jgi:2-polyprenyl-3-methyl-5-hydroxy-6-metoxy-1,4-benzoquinol methylase
MSCTTQKQKNRPGGSVDPAEVAKFATAAGHDWWDPSGPAAPLHAMNPTRVLFARRAICEAHG